MLENWQFAALFATCCCYLLGSIQTRSLGDQHVHRSDGLQKQRSLALVCTCLGNFVTLLRYQELRIVYRSSCMSSITKLFLVCPAKLLHAPYIPSNYESSQQHFTTEQESRRNATFSFWCSSVPTSPIVTRVLMWMWAPSLQSDNRPQHSQMGKFGCNGAMLLSLFRWNLHFLVVSPSPHADPKCNSRAQIGLARGKKAKLPLLLHSRAARTMLCLSNTGSVNQNRASGSACHTFNDLVDRPDFTTYYTGPRTACAHL